MSRIKKIFVNLLAVAMALTCCLMLTACEDIKKLQLKIEVYNYSGTTGVEEYTMDIDLYRHLAPKTVDAVVDYVNGGYYNDAIFYKFNDYNNQFMMGDLLFKDNQIVLNEVKPQLPGEFEYGGTVGSDLVNKKGSIGLWRSWYECDSSYKTSSPATASGRATWFIPNSTITGYNKYFCVFAQFNATADNNLKTIDALNAAFNQTDYDEYVIYYTGEYDSEKADQNYGLTFNISLLSDFDENQIEDLFVAEGAELVCYNKATIKVPVGNTGAPAAKIVEAKIV